MPLSNGTRHLIRHLLTTTGERLPNPAELDKVFDARTDTLHMFLDGQWYLIVGPSPTSWRSYN